MSFNIFDFDRYMRDRINEAFSPFYDWQPNEYRRALPEGPNTGSSGAVAEIGNGSSGPLSQIRRFRMDLNEKPDGYAITAELPGMAKDNIQVYTEGDVLTIIAEKHDEKKDEHEKKHIYERSYGKFQRTLRMPENCSMEDPTVKYDNGILHLDFKKKEPTNRKVIKF
jgi:HSP20 family molecular chaperone IbpA